MSKQVRCDNCGALMDPGADGRTYACSYCGARQLVAVDAQQIAQGMKLDLSNVDAFLLELAHSLHASFGGRMRVQADGNRIAHFELNLDPDLFVAKREGHVLVTQHRKMVRGIALKTATQPLDQWVKQLTNALAAHANESARVAQVVAHLRGGQR